MVADAAAASPTPASRLLQPLVNATGRAAPHQPRPGADRRRGARRGRPPWRAAPRTSSCACATGARGSRHEHAGALLARAVGAEAGLVVNNNAAAVLLALGALARDREVIVSRGELVEIGGGFRVPDIMAESRCRLVEVGTTNRTRRADYERALHRRHRAPPQGPRVELPDGRLHRDDADRRARRARSAGDGRRRIGAARRDHALAPGPARRGCTTSPGSARRSRPAPTVVTFSGDKLLGGPQAGIIVGRADADRRDRPPPARPRDARRQDDARRAAADRARRTCPATRPRSRSGAWPPRRSTALRARAERIAAARRRARRSSTPRPWPGAGRCPGSPSRRSGVADRAGARRRRRWPRCGRHGVIARTEAGARGVRPAQRRPRRRRIVAAALAAT